MRGRILLDPVPPAPYLFGKLAFFASSQSALISQGAFQRHTPASFPSFSFFVLLNYLSGSGGGFPQHRISVASRLRFVALCILLLLTSTTLFGFRWRLSADPRLHFMHPCRLAACIAWVCYTSGFRTWIHTRLDMVPIVPSNPLLSMVI